MICVKKFGGSLFKSKNDLLKISYNIVENFISDSKVEKTKYIIVVSALNKKTKELKIEFENIVNNLSEQNEAAYLVTGELQIAPMLSALINNFGIKSTALNAMQIELLTDDNYLNANILSVNKDKIDNYFFNNDILIICGYQGITKDFNFTTLGFNGSDYTALYLATKYNVPCEIYKDYSLKIYNDSLSKNIPYLSYEQMVFLIDNGVNIFQKKFIELAKCTNTKILLKGTINETIISTKKYTSKLPLNIQEINQYKVKIYSPYINSNSFIHLIKKHFNISDIFIYDKHICFYYPKKYLSLIEDKSSLILNTFKNTTFIVDDYIEYKIIFPNLHILNIKKDNNIDFKLLEDVSLC